MESWDLGTYSPNGQGLSGSLTHFLAVLGLPCCVGFSLVVASWDSSSCHVWTSHYGGFSWCREQAQQLWLTGLAAPCHVRSSRIRDQTCVSCIGRQILIHCTNREAQSDQFCPSSQNQLCTLSSEETPPDRLKLMVQSEPEICGDISLHGRAVGTGQ